MPSTAYTAMTNAWSTSNRYQAVADVDVLISTTSGGPGVFEIGTSSTPAISPGQGHPIQRGESRALQLKTGEYLWLAARSAKPSDMTLIAVAP